MRRGGGRLCRRRRGQRRHPEANPARRQAQHGQQQGGRQAALAQPLPPGRLSGAEHQQPGATKPPSFTAVSPATNGAVNLSATGETDLRYVFEASTNLVNWTRLGVRTNLTGSIQFTDITATNFPQRFYRVLAPLSDLP